MFVPGLDGDFCEPVSASSSSSSRKEIELRTKLYPGATLNKHCVVVRRVVTLSGKQDSQFSGYQVRLRCNLIMVIENIILPF